MGQAIDHSFKTNVSSERMIVFPTLSLTGLDGGQLNQPRDVGLDQFED